ncbi:MAG: hypothetical protein BroJett003_01780 [Planctomycetota bacterium]|nr:MAG: hypothetical protein BroJett003_01780 [Planctomycetota bacterium]
MDPNAPLIIVGWLFGIVFWVAVFKYILIPAYRWGSQNPESVKRGILIARKLLRK